MDEPEDKARQEKRKESLHVLNDSMHGRPDMEVQEGETVRINRFLALAGFGSRRAVEAYVIDGRVRVGGEKAVLETRVAPDDLVFVDDKLVLPPRAALYIAFNKPAGYLVSRRSQGGAPTIYNLLPENMQDLNYAGRLDRFSRGLLLLSQDGHFLQAITHPTFRLTKKYKVKLDRMPEQDWQRAFLRGIDDDDELLRALSVSILDRKSRLIEVVLGQGKKRQIRRMFEAVGARVMDLYRVAIGELDVEKIGLAEGKFIAIEPGSIFHGADAGSVQQAAGFVNLSDPGQEST